MIRYEPVMLPYVPAMQAKHEEASAESQASRSTSNESRWRPPTSKTNIEALRPLSQSQSSSAQPRSGSQHSGSSQHVSHNGRVHFVLYRGRVVKADILRSFQSGRRGFNLLQLQRTKRAFFPPLTI
jgi:hypothetical protein